MYSDHKKNECLMARDELVNYMRNDAIYSQFENDIKYFIEATDQCLAKLEKYHNSVRIMVPNDADIEYQNGLDEFMETMKICYSDINSIDTRKQFSMQCLPRTLKEVLQNYIVILNKYEGMRLHSKKENGKKPYIKNGDSPGHC